ncbi:MAG: hypothetical protein V3S69_06275 [Dehalococcoidales bacterium]
MPTGINPRDVRMSQPTNPLKVSKNRVVSPTLGGSGNTVHRPTSELDPFVNGKGNVIASKASIPTIL